MQAATRGLAPTARRNWRGARAAIPFLAQVLRSGCTELDHHGYTVRFWYDIIGQMDQQDHELRTALSDLEWLQDHIAAMLLLVQADDLHRALDRLPEARGCLRAIDRHLTRAVTNRRDKAEALYREPPTIPPRLAHIAK